MRNFRRENRSGDRRSFGGRNDSNRPTLHQTTCSNCGKPCEVPFRPTGSKPVYCSDCFQNNDSESHRSEGRRFERSGSHDRQMYDAVCSNCGETCKIPFQPRQGKPVFCSRCFEQNEGSDRRRSNDQPSYKAQFEALHAKMDKILAILAPTQTETTPVDSILNEEVIDQLVEEVTEEKPKKKSTKKSSSKSKSK